MSNSLQVRNRTIEIATRLQAGARTSELLTEYAEKWSCSTRTIERLIAKAKDRLSGKLSPTELEAKLCGIASGKTTTVKVFSVKGGYQTFQLAPDINERLKAIKEIFKLRSALNRDI